MSGVFYFTKRRALYTRLLFISVICAIALVD